MKTHIKRTEMRTIRYVMVVPEVVVFLILVWVFLLNSKPLYTTDIYQLDMREAPVPTQWECDGCTHEPIAKWSYEEWSNLDLKQGKLPITFPVDSNVKTTIIHWVDEENGYVIELVIADYGNPLMAKINFNLDNPKGRLRKEFSNFIYTPENMVPPGWDWVNKNASDEIVLCGEGNQEHCWGWFYQARYGQYYLLIYYYQDMNYHGFEEIVKAINAQFVKNLK